MRYLAADFGPLGIRVNAHLAGPDAHARRGGHRRRARHVQSSSARIRRCARSVTIEDVGGAALYLLVRPSAGVTGEVHFVDAGYNIISMPRPEDIKSGG